MELWHALTRRRNIPEVPATIAAVALILLAAYAGWAAVRPEGPPVTDITDQADLMQDSREMVAHGEALLQAVRDSDQRQVEQRSAEFHAWSRREAEREADRAVKRAAAVAAARAWFGLIAALTFAVGAWLLIAGRQSWPE
jgi:hypothetical protein